MRFRVCLLILSFMTIAAGQEVKSSVEFYDTTVSQKTGEIGWIGNAANGSFFIDANGQKKLVIKNDTTTITGQVRANSFAGDGSNLTGIAVDSISWSKIKGIPADFADGVDNIGTGAVAGDSVRAASIADSCRKFPAISMVDSARAASIADSCKKIPAITKVDSATIALRTVIADSARAASIADSCRKFPAITKVDSATIALRTVIADSARAASIADSCKKIPKISRVDSAKVALRADSLGAQPASKYALKTDVSNSMGIAYCEDHIRERGQKYILTSTPIARNSISITVPDAGYIFVSAFAEFQCESNSGMVAFGMISDAVPSTDNYGGYSVMSLIKSDPDSTVNQATLNYSQSRVFQVSSPGTYTYKLYAWLYSVSGPASMYNNSINAIYIKTLMGTGTVK